MSMLNIGLIVRNLILLHANNKGADKTVHGGFILTWSQMPKTFGEEADQTAIPDEPTPQDKA